MSETFDEAVGKNIAALRQNRGLSQSDLAERVNELGEAFRQQTVLKIEKGSRPIKLSEALNISRALGVTPYALWDGSGNERSGRIARQMAAVLARADDLRKAVGRLYPDLVHLANLLGDSQEEVEPVVEQHARDCVETDWGSQVNEWLAEDLRSEFGSLPDGYVLADLAERREQ